MFVYPMNINVQDRSTALKVAAVYLSLVDVAGEGAVDELADGGHAGPVAKVAGCRVPPLQDVPILALVKPDAAVSRRGNLWRYPCNETHEHGSSSKIYDIIS